MQVTSWENFQKIFSSDKNIFIFVKGCLNFAKEEKFSAESTSVILAVLNRAHIYSCQTSFENTIESAAFMRELILTHSYLRPPFAIQVFKQSEAKAALDYLIDTYFR